MENKKKKGHQKPHEMALKVAVLLVGVITTVSVAFTALNPAAMTSLFNRFLADSAEGTTDNRVDCKALSEQMARGEYTAEDKAVYGKYCLENIDNGTSPEQEHNDQNINDQNNNDNISDWDRFNCSALKEKALSGDKDSVARYIEICVENRTPAPTVRPHERINPNGDPSGKDYHFDQRPAQKPEQAHFDPCAEMKNFMDKHSDELTTEEGQMAQKRYGIYCGVDRNSANVCDELKTKLENSIQSGDTNSDEYAKAKLGYNELCTDSKPANDRCEELKNKMETHFATSDANSTDYSSAKRDYLQVCQKDVPPAGYEDEVLTKGTEEDNPFTDTDVNSKEGLAALELYRRGVIGGFKDGTFHGEKLVNRAEAAKFLLLARYGVFTDEESGDSSFRDTVKGQWYMKFITRAARLGIIKGYKDGTFKPANTVNTAEFLKMLSLTFDLETGSTSSYSDVKADDWFAPYVAIAEQYQLFPDRTAGKLDPGRDLTRKEVAVAIYQYLSNRDGDSTTQIKLIPR